MTHIKYRKDIDGIRAVAVLFVLMGHAFPSIFPGGFIGVDIFFVISGFLITGNIIRDINSDNFSFSEFYRRRVARIMPSYILVVLVIMCAGLALLDKQEFNILISEAYASLLCAVNFLLAQQSGYFDSQSYAKPFLNLWSLAVEEQFYLFWPVLIYFSFKTKLKKIIIISCIGASLLCSIIYTKYDPVHSYYLLPSRLWELAAGGYLAMYFTNTKNNLFIYKKYIDIIYVFSIISIFVFFLSWSDLNSFPGAWSSIPVIFTIFALYSSTSVFNKKILAHPILTSVGKISYSLYLWHWPLLSFVAIISGNNSHWYIRIYALIASFCLAFFTTKYFENNFKVMLQSIKNKKSIIFGCIALQIIMALIFHNLSDKITNLINTKSWYTTISYENFEKNYGVKQWEIERQSNDKECPVSRFSEGHSVDYCRLTSQNPKLAIIGDSHANHLVPGLSHLKSSEFSNLVQVSYGGCASVGEVVLYQKDNYRNVRECYEANKKFINMIIDDKNIKSVIFSYSSDNLAINGLLMYPDLDNNLENLNLTRLDFIENSLNNLISNLIKENKKVYFLIDSPKYLVDPKLCVADRPLSRYISKSNECSPTLTSVIEKQRVSRELIANLKSRNKQLVVIDATSSMCQGGSCNLALSGQLLYRDAGHLSIDGSGLLARSIFATIPQ